MRPPRRTTLAAAALVFSSLALTGCGEGAITSGSTTPRASVSVSLAASESGPLRLSDGWVVSTSTMAVTSASAAASSAGMSGMSAGPTTPMSAAYAVIRNTGDADDALVAVSTSAAGEAQLHTTVENSSGAGTMKRVESIPVPAHGTATLQMGGYHVMLLGLTRPLPEGSAVTMTWTFRSGTAITTTFPVISREHRPGA